MSSVVACLCLEEAHQDSFERRRVFCLFRRQIASVWCRRNSFALDIAWGVSVVGKPTYCLCPHHGTSDSGHISLLAPDSIDEGRDLFADFRETTEEIARLQSKLREGRYSSRRIRRLYRKRTRRRDHAQDALVRDLMDRLYDEGVATVYVGDLTDVLSAQWSAAVNEKTHQFWAYRSFIDRLATTAEEYGITVEVRSEAYTTAECPVCGERDETERDGDVFRCSCGYEGHADLDASRTFLERQAGTNLEVGSMARPVRLKWDDHNWSERPHSPERASPNEKRTNRSTSDGKLASVGTA